MPLCVCVGGVVCKQGGVVVGGGSFGTCGGRCLTELTWSKVMKRRDALDLGRAGAWEQGVDCTGHLVVNVCTYVLKGGRGDLI